MSIIYHFVLRSRAGQVEELGFMPLVDDREAVAFAETVIQDLAEGSPTLHAGSVMEVTSGERSVGSIRSR
jgi:hypothetical protein